MENYKIEEPINNLASQIYMNRMFSFYKFIFI